jgi:hypothetical protein
MSPTATTAPSGTKVLQGIEVPAQSVNQGAFFALTRRKRTTEYNRVFAGAGLTDNVELRKSDIVAGIHVRFVGNIVTTHSTGGVVATYRWPYDFAKAFRFTANGQSNLINCSGAKLKARELMHRVEFDDRGVSQQVGGSAVTQGTLSMGSEKWGIAPGQSQATSATIPVEITWFIPIAADEKDLSGAIFAQTSAMDLTLSIDWEQVANLFTVSGGDTVTLNGNVICETEKFSIPVQGGQFVLPDLSLFHSIVQTRVATGLSQGDNELRLIGQGAGKSLLRLFFQVWNGAGPQVPLAMNAANYGPQGWRYGSNETPELFPDGSSLREWNERCYNSDVGGLWGFGCHEFEAVNAFRDAVDMGQTSELRLYTNLASGSLVNPAIEYVQETVFAAGSGS